MSWVLESMDFLPKNLNPLLRTVVYVLILAHLLILVGWMVYTCPTMFKSNSELSRERMQKLNKEKES